MTLPVRRALAFFFICLFVVAAPAALAYARGYRFDLATRQLRQTGVIAVHGQPKNVLLRLDGQQQLPGTLPYTYRSISSGMHVIEIAAPGYSSQTLLAQVLPGQANYLPQAQLLRSSPVLTVRTGLPNSAVLAPAGNAAAWVADGRVVIASKNATLKSSVIKDLASTAWATNHLECFDAKKKFLGIVELDGTYTLGGATEVTTHQELAAIAKNAGITFSHAQRVDTLRAWLVTTADAAWFVEDNGAVSLVTRWAEAPLAARMVSDSILAIIRPNGITLRNLGNNHTQTFEQLGIRTVADEPAAGVVNFLVKDGDLRSWMRASFF